ncbi:MAG: hypothetical protein IPM22_20210 [Betaproteobacteria bacterium]|nr:hypothetical protein [Betaproteobacteria bacterium]
MSTTPNSAERELLEKSLAVEPLEACAVALATRSSVGRCPAFALLDLHRRDVVVRLREAHRQVLLQRAVDPVVDGVRARQHRIETRAEGLQARREVSDDRAQRRAPAVELVLRLDLGRHDLVVLRLRFVGVGDRRRADLEVALRLRELLGDGDLLLLGQVDIELGEQHVEVRDRGADDEVLLRDRQREVRLRDLLLRLVERHRVLRPVQRLRRRKCQVALAVVGRRRDLRRRVDRRVVRVDVGCPGRGELRQQRRPRLRDPLLRGLPLRARGGDGGVVLLRLAVDLQQVLAGGRAGREQRSQARDESEAAGFRLTLGFHERFPSLRGRCGCRAGFVTGCRHQ